MPARGYPRGGLAGRAGGIFASVFRARNPRVLWYEDLVHPQTQGDACQQVHATANVLCRQSGLGPAWLSDFGLFGGFC